MSLPPFQVFLDEHRHAVYGFLRATLHQDADDAFQETFLSALRAYPRLRHAGNLRAWVLTIAARKAVDIHRRRSRAPVPVDAVPEQVAGPGADAVDAELWALVDGLPAKQRAAVVHRFVDDLSYEEIGGRMGTTPEAARRNVHEAMRKLRQRWTTSKS